MRKSIILPSSLALISILTGCIDESDGETPGSVSAEITFVDLPSEDNMALHPKINIRIEFDMDYSGGRSEGDVYFNVYSRFLLADPSITTMDELFSDVFYYDEVTSNSYSAYSFTEFEISIVGTTLSFSVPRSSDLRIAEITNTTPLKITTEYNTASASGALSQYRAEDALPDFGYIVSGVDRLSLTDNTSDVEFSVFNGSLLDGQEIGLDIGSARVNVTVE